MVKELASELSLDEYKSLLVSFDMTVRFLSISARLFEFLSRLEIFFMLAVDRVISDSFPITCSKSLPVKLLDESELMMFVFLIGTRFRSAKISIIEV